MYNNASVNKVLLIGHITKEPWLHHTGNEKPLLLFTLATTEVIKTQGGDIAHTETHHIRINADNPCLKNLKLKKDHMVYVQGKLQTHAFVDEQKIKRYKTEVFAHSVELS